MSEGWSILIDNWGTGNVIFLLVLIINDLLFEFLSESFSNFKSFRIYLLPSMSSQGWSGSSGTLGSRFQLTGFRISQLLLSLGFLHGQQLVPLQLQVSRPLSQGLLRDLENISMKIFSLKKKLCLTSCVLVGGATGAATSPFTKSGEQRMRFSLYSVWSVWWPRGQHDDIVNCYERHYDIITLLRQF